MAMTTGRVSTTAKRMAQRYAGRAVPRGTVPLRWGRTQTTVACPLPSMLPKKNTMAWSRGGILAVRRNGPALSEAAVVRKMVISAVQFVGEGKPQERHGRVVVTTCIL